MKLPRLITRGRAKWVGSILFAFLLQISVTSIWHSAFIERRSFAAERSITHDRILAFTRGGLAFVTMMEDYSQVDDTEFVDMYLRDRFESSVSFRIGRGTADEPLLHFWFQRATWLPPATLGLGVSHRYIFVPAWLPLLLSMAPTVYLWRTDRRAKAWQCTKCRYDLPGIEGGRCPECGEQLKPSTDEGAANR